MLQTRRPSAHQSTAIKIYGCSVFNLSSYKHHIVILRSDDLTGCKSLKILLWCQIILAWAVIYFPYQIQQCIRIKKKECIPVGCVTRAAVAVTGVSTHPPEQAHPSLRSGPPWSRHPQEQAPPRYGPGDSPTRSPSTFPLGVGLETPLARSPSTFPLGVGLETCKACWDTTRPCEQNDRQV